MQAGRAALVPHLDWMVAPFDERFAANAHSPPRNSTFDTYPTLDKQSKDENTQKEEPNCRVNVAGVDLRVDPAVRRSAPPSLPLAPLPVPINSPTRIPHTAYIPCQWWCRLRRKLAPWLRTDLFVRAPRSATNAGLAPKLRKADGIRHLKKLISNNRAIFLLSSMTELFPL